MSLLKDIEFLFTVLQSSYGWVIILTFFAYQMYWPFGQTKFQTVQDDVMGEIEQVKEFQVALTQVVRALCRVNEDQININRVDEYLVKNGVQPDDFMREDRDVPSAEKTEGDDADVEKIVGDDSPADTGDE